MFCAAHRDAAKSFAHLFGSVAPAAAGAVREHSQAVAAPAAHGTERMREVFARVEPLLAKVDSFSGGPDEKRYRWAKISFYVLKDELLARVFQCSAPRLSAAPPRATALDLSADGPLLAAIADVLHSQEEPLRQAESSTLDVHLVQYAGAVVICAGSADGEEEVLQALRQDGAALVPIAVDALQLGHARWQ